MAENAVYIPSIDAKDIWINSHLHHSPETGYSLRTKAGDINTRKFRNTLDYSLDLLKLREVYGKVCRNNGFSFRSHGKEYCKHVINVTFKYAAKEYNRHYGNMYVKFGYSVEDADLHDCTCIRDGELVAIQIDCPVETPVPPAQLGKHFTFADGMYKVKSDFKTVCDTARMRTELYQDGFVCDGIRYVRYKRSSGSSRVGKCLFINEKLYERMHRWGLCGLRIRPGDQVDLAALESYISLTLSSIIGTLEIRPENILVIDDYSSEFYDDVIVTTTDDKGLVSYPENAAVSNNIWDGQSLISKNAMGKYQDCGFVLLRNRFFKSACFNTNLAQWFEDRGVAEVSQLNGFTLATELSQIKLITTPSSIKYLKFGTVRQWLQNLDPMFGVVKTEKETRFFDGRMVQTHYQLLNTLQLSIDEVEELLAPSLAYLTKIRTDPAVLRFHIRYAENHSYDSPCLSKNDVIYRFLGHNEKFAATKLYLDFRKDVVKAFLKKLKHGHVLVTGTYATLFGNPMEMLLQTIGQFDGRPLIGVGNIHTTRFPFDTTLLGSRSPHVSMGNILVAENRDKPDIRRYFNLTDEIVCVNSIGENILSRLSGADFDSDTMLLTDNPTLLSAAKRNYHAFHVATNTVAAKTILRRYTPAEQADLDIQTSVNKIGEIVNLSQELNTLIWQKVNSGVPIDSAEVAMIYNDVSTLNVLSNIEIDKAKREYPVDSIREIQRIRQKYSDHDDAGRQIKPHFFGVIAKSKGYYDDSKKCYQYHQTTMDYVQMVIGQHRHPRSRQEKVSFADMLFFSDYDTRKVVYQQAQRILDLVRQYRKDVTSVWTSGNHVLEISEKFMLVNDIYQKAMQSIDSLKINRHTMYYLVSILHNENNSDITRTAFSLLFQSSSHDFYQFVMRSKTEIEKLVEDDHGSIEIYDFRYKVI